MSLRGGNPMCCICDTPKQIVIQKQPPKEQDTARTVQRTMANNDTTNGTKVDHPTGMNGIADTGDVTNGYSGSNEEDYYPDDQYENDHGADYNGYNGYHAAPHHGPDAFDPYNYGPPPHHGFHRGRGRGRGHKRGRGRRCRGR